MYPGVKDPIKMGKPVSRTLDTYSILARKEALTLKYSRNCGYYCAPSMHKEPHNILLVICLLVAPQHLTIFLSGIASTGPTTYLLIALCYTALPLPLEALGIDYPEGDIILPVLSASLIEVAELSLLGCLLFPFRY